MVQGEAPGLVESSDVQTWWTRVVVSKLDEETQCRVLNYIVEKFGVYRGNWFQWSYFVKASE